MRSWKKAIRSSLSTGWPARMVAVSYTHLDVYKRQVLFYIQKYLTARSSDQMARCFFRNSIGPFVLLGRVMYNKKTIQKGGSRLDKRMYLSIDLKSFYASVECLEHGLDPMTTNLVVADAGCTEKTICLAISPSLKSCGIPGRARLFKVKQAGQRAAAAI